MPDATRVVAPRRAAAGRILRPQDRFSPTDEVREDAHTHTGRTSTTVGQSGASKAARTAPSSTAQTQHGPATRALPTDHTVNASNSGEEGQQSGGHHHHRSGTGRQNIGQFYKMARTQSGTLADMQGDDRIKAPSTRTERNAAAMDHLLRTHTITRAPVVKKSSDLREPKTAAEARQNAEFPEELNDKVLYGTRQCPETTRLLGAHSPRILRDSRFNVHGECPQPDGSTRVLLQKNLGTYDEPEWSKEKVSTLAPRHWSDQQIVDAGRAVLSNERSFAGKGDDGSHYFVAKVDGVEWQVVVGPAGQVTGSFPTGGSPSLVASTAT